jgi:protease PrsW
LFCINCGTPHDPAARFCVKCGTPFQVVAEASGTAVTPASAPAQVAVAMHPHHRHSLIESFTTRLNSIAGTEKLDGFSLKEMFSEVFKRRPADEMEEYFVVGTPKTTPAIEYVQTGWPKPWFFARVLIFLTIAYVVLLFGLNEFRNPNLVPGLLFLGTFAAPLAVVVLFFEMNTPRNVSLHKLTVLFISGAVISLMVALVGFSVSNLDSWLGASSAGIVEEIAKLLTVLIIIRGVRYKYILNGMLFGATVGAGFGAFESAGYAFNALLKGGMGGMVDSIQLRAFLAPGMHVAWTAIAAGALYRVKQDSKLKFEMLFDPRFLKAFCIPMVLHMTWNAPFQLPFFIKQIVLTAIAWYVIFALIQQGLHQVRDEQKLRLKETLDQLQAASPDLAAHAGAAK